MATMVGRDIFHTTGYEFTSSLMESSPHERALSPKLEALLALLSDDERPTFILDASDSPQIVYRNASLISYLGDTYGFETWVAGLPASATRNTSATVIGNFGGRKWFGKRVGSSCWTVVYCSWAEGEYGQHEADRLAVPNEDITNRLVRVMTPRRRKETPRCCDYTTDKLSDWYFDWIHSPCCVSDPWIRFLQTHDWENTALGPMDGWPSDLCRLAILVLSAPDPRLVVWGDDLLMLFNDSAKTIFGDSYLRCLGNPLEHGLGKSVVDQDLACLRRNLRAGRIIKDENSKYTINRYGFPEEAYFDFSIAPVPGDDGYLMGAVIEFNESFATHKERRHRMIGTVVDIISHSSHLEALWASLLNGFTRDQEYVAYAAIYARTNIDKSESEVSSPEGSYRLHSSIGIDHSQLQKTVNTHNATKTVSLEAAFQNSQQSRTVHVLQQRDETLPQTLAVPTEEHGNVHTACIMPIGERDMPKPLTAFLVVGMNPKLHLTKEDHLMMGHLRDVISKTSSVISLPECQLRDKELETLNKDLARRLQISALEAKKSEERFTTMARDAPFGMFMFSPEGSPVFVNEAWLKLSGFSSMEELEQRAKSGLFWQDLIPPEDAVEVSKCWVTAFASKSPTKHEQRVLIPQTPEGALLQKPREYQWLEVNSYPELDEQNNLLAVRGWLVDINDRKLAESLMLQRLEDALETKRASERFIDMVSHEIRNPLSAVVQLADGILSSDKETPEAIDAAQTIVLCAQHQKKIVDDVLVISKLDSNLLVLSPDRCQPPALIQKALKMHESELHKADIHASLRVDKSYANLNVDSVFIDESRVLQVVINLLGNAIKFTSGSETRRIVISLTASLSAPTGDEYAITYAAQRIKSPALERSKSNPFLKSASSQDMYIQLAVEDTGRGLAKDETERLFQRFSQASPKTHRKYGGSGLGLYISKELTELQGGQIGVSSAGLGKGSTFAFYIKATRCEPPVPSIQTTTAPIAAQEAPLSTPTRTSNARSTTPKKSPPKTVLSAAGLHVLVVEDNAINQKVMAQQLRRAGCTVHVANHGLEALTFLRTTSLQDGDIPLSVILMDVEMPVMDGMTCTRRIREIEQQQRASDGAGAGDGDIAKMGVGVGIGEKSRHVPIIAVTANARNQQIEEALSAGVDEVVTKPFRIPELIPRMKALALKTTGGASP